LIKFKNENFHKNEIAKIFILTKEIHEEKSLGLVLREKTIE